MPIYDMYPYSNLHELNLDFIIKLCEEFKDGVEGFEQEITDLGTRLEGEIDALEDRIEPFEQMFTLQTVGGETQIRANYRMYAGHGLTASSLKVNGALELEQPFTINLTGDVEGTASTNNLLNPLNIETTVVNGGGGGGETLPKVIFDGTIQGQAMGEQIYVYQFEEPLELVPGCRYQVFFDQSEEIRTFDYVNQPAYGHGLAVPGMMLSYGYVMLFNDNPHTLKIMQVDQIEKRLIYQAVNAQFTAQDDFFQNSKFIPGLGMGDYTIVWDGTVYNLKSHITDMSNTEFNPAVPTIGSESIVTGGETPEYPFVFTLYRNATNSTEGYHNFAIYGPKVKSDEVVLYSVNNPATGVYNAVSPDPFLNDEFDMADDLAQYIQDKTPVIINCNNGQPQSGKQYPQTYRVNTTDNEVTISIFPDGSNLFLYGIGTVGSE